MQNWKEIKSHDNNLQLDIISDEIKCLNRLDILLICKMLLFQEIAIMQKGQSPTFLGAVVDVAVDVNETFNNLPSWDNTYSVKLKKRLIFIQRSCSFWTS